MYVKKEKKRKSPQRKFRDRNKLRRGERCQTQSSGEVEGESHLSSWKSWTRGSDVLSQEFHWPLVSKVEKTHLGPGLCSWLG